MIFPLEDLPEDIQDFIKNKVVRTAVKSREKPRNECRRSDRVAQSPRFRGAQGGEQ